MLAGLLYAYVSKCFVIAFASALIPFNLTGIEWTKLPPQLVLQVRTTDYTDSELMGFKPFLGNPDASWVVAFDETDGWQKPKPKVSS